MDNRKVKINKEVMEKFFENFDSIELKYNLDVRKEEGSEEKIDEKIEEKTEEKTEDKIRLYATLEEIESAYQFSELTKNNYDSVVKNLDLIYDAKDDSDQIVRVYDLVKNKIIHQYICIDGLERLFSDKYIDFEWDMHLGIDYRKHQMKFYRDHFVHQIRNLYCLHMMLSDENVGDFSEKQHGAGDSQENDSEKVYTDNDLSKRQYGLGLFHLVRKVLEVPSNSKVSRYTYKMVEQQKQRGHLQGDKVKLWGSKNDIDFNKRYNTDEFYYRNIIFMAGYMAALFHDIGYPEVSNMQNQRRITEYIANLYNAESSGYDYFRLNALLQNSFLFRVVSFAEIRDRMTGEKPDHGAFSAIIFLLNFYENGAIHGLEPYKRCAVELAAFAIYNHTNKYSYSKEAGKNGYIRNSFLLNPISYLLRICDDLQEWNRIYFELSKASNLIVCNQCRTPVIRKDKENKKDKKRKQIYYTCNCNCGKEEGIFSPIFNYAENFPYRRIYNVSVCDNLVMECKEIEGTKKWVKFKLEYKLDRLLHIAYINPDYAKYRIKELNQLKRLLDYQLELPLMYLQYFVTANPVLIKVQILNLYFEQNPEKFGEIDFSPVINYCNDCMNKLTVLNHKMGNDLRVVQRDIDFEDVRIEKVKSIKERYKKDERELIRQAFIDITPALEDWQRQIEGTFYPIIDAIYDYKGKDKDGNDFSFINKKVRESISLYIKLMLIMKISMKLNEEKQDNDLFAVLYEYQQKGELEQDEVKGKNILKLVQPEYDMDLRGLIGDCIKQFMKLYEKIEDLDQKPENYYTQFDTEDYVYGCIKRFLNTSQYVPVCQRKEETGRRRSSKNVVCIDAFSDLAFFQKLLAMIEDSKRDCDSLLT